MKKNKQILILIGFIILSYFTYHIYELSFLKSFLGWFETFFHEISHGLASVFTGGQISSIELDWNGSGLCYSGGGNGTITTFSGYFGASIWGSFIYLLTSHENKTVNKISIGGLLTMMGIFIFYSGNFTTIIILLSMIMGRGIIFETFNCSNWTKNKI